VKIVVYAIAKNEAKFVDAWMDSMGKADAVVVLDTGSTDGTAEKLRERGADVSCAKIEPWRFDVARNASLDYARAIHPDADWFVCTDLDEKFADDGWREILEKAVADTKADVVLYRYKWMIATKADGADIGFTYNKIHRAGKGRWKYPVHEYLEGIAENGYCNLYGHLVLEHHPDPEKGRSYYGDLMELALDEHPTSPHCQFIYGRELWARKDYAKAESVLLDFVDNPKSRWTPQKADALYMVARCHGERGDLDGMELWLWRAICLDPTYRTPACEMMDLLTSQERWQGVVLAGRLCLMTENRNTEYQTNTRDYGPWPWETLANALLKLGVAGEAVKAEREALARAENVEDRMRIESNLRALEEATGAKSANSARND